MVKVGARVVVICRILRFLTGNLEDVTLLY